MFPPADGATNFARDDALLGAARETGRVVIRLYTWSEPVISFGRNERVVGRFDPGRLESAGLGVVRRPTGGRALFHHRELTYAVAGPAQPGDTLHDAYDRLSDILRDALRHLGIAATRAPRRPAAPSLEGTPCFAVPSAGELVVDGRKLIASAQWREGGAYLQHGSILIDNDQPSLTAGLAPGIALPPLPAPATLRALLGRAPTLDEFARALTAALEERTAVVPDVVSPADIIDDAVVRARCAHYSDPAWTWRR